MAAGAAGDAAADFGVGFELKEALGIVLAVEFGGGVLAKHGEEEFKFGHVVAQALVLEAFFTFEFAWTHAKGGFGDLIGEGFEVFGISYSPLLPFIGEFAADIDGAKTVFLPVLVVELRRCVFHILLW